MEFDSVSIKVVKQVASHQLYVSYLLSTKCIKGLQLVIEIKSIRDDSLFLLEAT